MAGPHFEVFINSAPKTRYKCGEDSALDLCLPQNRIKIITEGGRSKQRFFSTYNCINSGGKMSASEYWEIVCISLIPSIIFWGCFLIKESLSGWRSNKRIKKVDYTCHFKITGLI